MENTPKAELIEKLRENITNLTNKKITPLKTSDKDNDETFNRLLEIQLLIKKESGLKELCK